MGAIDIQVVTPTSHILAFGTVPDFNTATLHITLRAVNGTLGDAISWTGALSGSDAAMFTAPASGALTDEVPPTGDVTYAVTFTPTSVGAKTATFTITFAGPSSPIVISLTGTGGSGGFLTLVPQTTNDFGMVKDGTTSAPLNVLAENNSGADVTVTAIAFSGSAGAISGSAPDVEGTGYAVGDTGTVTGGGGSGATYIVTAVSGAGGVLAFNIMNPGLGYSTGSGVSTAVTTGGGDGAFTLDILTVLSGQFAAGAGQPTLPFTLLANGASPPVVIPVLFEPTITGFVLDPKAVVVTSNATNTPTAQAMQGTGVIIFPAYVIPFSPQAVLAAFVLSGVVVVLRMDSTDLDCEEPASFTRIYDWAVPVQEKYLGRVLFRYQDESATPFDLTCTANLTRAPLSVSDALINVGGANDGLIHNAFFDLQTSDDLIQIVISRAADDGPLVITEMFHEIDPRGEFVPT